MNRRARWVAGGVMAIAVLAVLRLLSFAPYTAERDVGAVLRFAWRARGERVRECRQLTREELERLPLHMREEEVCEGRLIPYRLVVVVDSVQVIDRLVRGAGARQDLPLYVFQDLAIQPGAHRVSVRFTLEAPSQSAYEEERHEGGEDEHGSPRPAPLRLALDTTLALTARRLLLVTYIEEREQLVVRNGSPR